MKRLYLILLIILIACGGQDSSLSDSQKPNPPGRPIPWECLIENNPNAPTTVIWWIDDNGNLTYKNNAHQSCGTLEFSPDCHIKQCSAEWYCADYLEYNSAHVQLEFKREFTGNIPNDYWNYQPLPEECDEYGAGWILKDEIIDTGQCDGRCL